MLSNREIINEKNIASHQMFTRFNGNNNFKYLPT